MNCHECGGVNEPKDLYVCEGHLQASKDANAKLADQLNQQNTLNEMELEKDLFESERKVKQMISQFHQLENFLKEKKLINLPTKLSDDIKTTLAKINADLASVNAYLSATLESILSQNLAKAKTTEVKPVEQKIATAPMEEESILRYNRDFLISLQRKKNVIPVPNEQHYVPKERMQLAPEKPVEEVTAMLQKLPNAGFDGQDFNARPAMSLKEQHQTSAMTTRSNDDDGSDDGWGSVKPVKGTKSFKPWSHHKWL